MTGDGSRKTGDGGEGMESNDRYKFQELEVDRRALEYPDNNSEGSTGQSDKEQHRFLGVALRSYLETVACTAIAQRREFVPPSHLMEVRP